MLIILLIFMLLSLLLIISIIVNITIGEIVIAITLIVSDMSSWCSLVDVSLRRISKYFSGSCDVVLEVDVDMKL